MYSQRTCDDIVYIDYSTSSYGCANNENSSSPDSLSNICRNNIIIYETVETETFKPVSD